MEASRESQEDDKSTDLRLANYRVYWEKLGDLHDVYQRASAAPFNYRCGRRSKWWRNRDLKARYDAGAVSLRECLDAPGDQTADMELVVSKFRFFATLMCDFR